MTNTKQSQQEQPEGLSAELLLRSWNKTLEVVTECERINKESGVRNPEQFTSGFGELPMTVKKYNKWIEECINSRNGQPHTLLSLISAGIISEEERQYYATEAVGRELLSMTRVQAVNKTEYLVRSEKWLGLNGESGAPYSITVDTLDYYKKITPEYTMVSIDPTRKSKEVRVAKIGRTLPGYEGIRKTYLTPFNLENVNAAIRDARSPTSDPTIANNTMLYLQRDGVTAICTVADFNTWVTSDFDTMFDSRLNTNTKSDLKELVAQLKQSNATSQSAGAYQ